MARRQTVKKRKPRKKHYRERTEVEKDPFYIDPKAIPKGRSYQWVPTHIMGVADTVFVQEAYRSGWRKVAKRKPVGGNVLMWITSDEADAQCEANIKRAKDLMAKARRQMGMDSGPERFSFFTTISEPYETIPSDTLPIAVQVVVPFRLSARFQDAAAALKLTPEVYAQRRAELYISGDIAGLMIPVNGVLELFEGGKFELTPRN